MLCIFLSLMTFPELIGWLLLVWFGVITVAMITQRHWFARIVIWILLVMLVVKFPERTWRLATLLLAIGCFDLLFYVYAQGRSHAKLIRTAATLFLLGAVSWFVLGRWHDGTRSAPFEFSPTRPIACLGDSLTDYGYPEVLQTRVSVPVLDFGRNGCTLEEAIAELLPQIEAARPQLVVVELGGHDFKDGRQRDEIVMDLSTIVERVQAYGADVVLVEIPRGFITDPMGGIEREVAAKYDLELIADTMIRKTILMGPNFPPGSWFARDSLLSNDNLHPNDNGNRLFARTVADSLERICGDGVLVKD